jgi:hypothetical protein
MKPNFPYYANILHYVTMTDPFLSGWGLAQGKINKLIFPCDSYAQAQIVEDNARARGDMQRINICANFPRYNSRTHYAQVKTIEDYPNFYRAGFFAMQKAQARARELEQAQAQA